MNKERVWTTYWKMWTYNTLVKGVGWGKKVEKFIFLCQLKNKFIYVYLYTVVIGVVAIL